MTRIRYILFVLVIFPLTGSSYAATAFSETTMQKIDCSPQKEEAKQPKPADDVQAQLYANRREEMAKMDANCDGLVQLKEWQDFFAMRFQAADADHDGRLSPAEHKALEETF